MQCGCRFAVAVHLRGHGSWQELLQTFVAPLAVRAPTRFPTLALAAAIPDSVPIACLAVSLVLTVGDANDDGLGAAPSLQIARLSELIWKVGGS